MDEYKWPEITKDTPLEEIKRIHKQIWDYVVKYGEKPYTTYKFNCAACEYVKEVYGGGAFGELKCFYLCPIAWERKNKDILEMCSTEYHDWLINRSVENSKRIRDIPFKFEKEAGA